MAEVNPTAEQPRYTLLIPTYNRPDDFGRLVRFLAYQQARFQILVLDSSRPENQQQNQAQARGLPLNLRFERFDSSMPPWEKFWRGAELVTTEFASFCADDDLLLISSIEPLLNFLEQNSDYSVAHGWYFNFVMQRSFALTGITYKGNSLDQEDPLDRLHQLLRNYEAITYGLYRTTLLKEVLTRTQGLRSLLGRELLGGTIAALSGKIARLPLLYAGRSLGLSGSYIDWHPAEFLLSSPQSLFDEYLCYRGSLLDSYAASGRIITDEVIALVDLAHMRYLTEHCKPHVIDYLFDSLRAGQRREEIVSGLWPLLANKQGLEGMLQRNNLLRRLRDRFFPWLRGHSVRKILFPRSYSTTATTTVSGKSRNFEIYQNFSRAVGSVKIEPTTEELKEVLRAYE